LLILSRLLDVCVESRSRTCLTQRIPDYIAAAKAAPVPDGAASALLGQTATYYVDEARLALGRPDVTAQIPAGPGWASEISYARELYLKRQLLAGRVQLALGRPVEAAASADRLLSMIASLRNPEASPATVARALAGGLTTLLDAGQAERAYGLYRATRETLPKAMPARSLDLALYRISEARLLGARADLPGARAAADAALSLLRDLELEPATRAELLAQALLLQAATCAAESDLACARGALAEAQPVASETPEYLATVAAVAALAGDPAAPPPAAVEADPYSLVAAALRTAPGPARAARFDAAARAVLGAERGFGGHAALEPLLVALLLQIGGGAGDKDAAFGLMQIAGRGASAFDAEAVAALSRAEGELQRRAVHQALRLRARRDRLEREQIQAVTERAVAAAESGGALTHDPAARLLLRDFAVRISRADAAGGKPGVTWPGVVTPLRRLQSVLGDAEAVLAVARTPQGLAYACVRRDRAEWRVAAVDVQKARLDSRLVQQALTSGHAPSDQLDSQFPVEAAIRLYDLYLRPFDGCVRARDRIVWLPGLANLAAPLSVMLPAAPPKREDGGYDLAQAPWVARSHAISYAGSAALIVAARKAPANGRDFDFLGVGDPVLSGETPTGERREALATRGARVAGLAPLPETRPELLASARAFASSQVLLGADATERRLRAQVLGAYAYVSFATHGLIREDLQGLAEPALVLTPVSGDDPLDDGLLTASEIADLNLRARFVALSACNTANFDLEALAQDLPALSSAFAVAGVPATLATLWPVDSETGRRVVAATFERLRAEGLAPSDALAAAQQLFLEQPPGRAWLHPRFWAPFVILGDGGLREPPARAPNPTVRQVEVLTARGGEVIGLVRAGGATVARLISDADPRGRHAGAVRQLSGAGGAWRRESVEVGASQMMVDLGGPVLVAGYAAGSSGRFAPVLEALSPAGELVATWRAQPPEGLDSFTLGGGALGGGRAAFVVGDLSLRGQAAGHGGRLRLFETDAALNPRVMAELAPPSGGNIAEATVSPFGDDLLLTYTDRAAAPPDRPPAALDDWQEPLCSVWPVTWIELRDGRTGALKARRELPGQVVTRVLATGGRVLLGGAAAARCGEDAQANVLTVGTDLATQPIYTDPSLGASEVRALAALPDGRTLLAASKFNVTDYAPPLAAGAKPDPYRWRRTDLTASGMLVVLERDGRAGAPRLLDSGSNVLVTALEASRPDDVLLGGSLAGEAALFHLRVSGER
jgi:CHAT domain-containing protein